MRLFARDACLHCLPFWCGWLARLPLPPLFLSTNLCRVTCCYSVSAGFVQRDAWNNSVFCLPSFTVLAGWADITSERARSNRLYYRRCVNADGTRTTDFAADAAGRAAACVARRSDGTWLPFCAAALCYEYAGSWRNLALSAFSAVGTSCGWRDVTVACCARITVFSVSVLQPGRCLYLPAEYAAHDVLSTTCGSLAVCGRGGRETINWLSGGAVLRATCIFSPYACTTTLPGLLPDALTAKVAGTCWYFSAGGRERSTSSSRRGTERVMVGIYAPGHGVTWGAIAGAVEKLLLLYRVLSRFLACSTALRCYGGIKIISCGQFVQDMMHALVL